MVGVGLKGRAPAGGANGSEANTKLQAPLLGLMWAAAHSGEPPGAAPASAVLPWAQGRHEVREMSGEQEMPGLLPSAWQRTPQQCRGG